MTEDSFNGWKNRETWALMLYVNNEQELQEQALEVVVEAFNEELETMLEREEQAERGNAISLASHRFQEWVEGWLTVDGYQQQFGDDMPVSIVRMVEDIGSLYRVNWFECAESLLEERLTEFDKQVSE